MLPINNLHKKKPLKSYYIILYIHSTSDHQRVPLPQENPIASLLPGAVFACHHGSIALEILVLGIGSRWGNGAFPIPYG
jgi:hypothetical protein